MESIGLSRELHFIKSLREGSRRQIAKTCLLGLPVVVKDLHHGHRFPAEVISCAVRWYFRFQLSLRDIEELLFERGVRPLWRPTY